MAVEFAILLPVFLMLLLGIVEFGLAFNTQITLTQAAREGARVMAVADDATAARNSVRSAAPALSSHLGDDNIDIISTVPNDPASTVIVDACRPGSQTIVTITYNFRPLTGFLGTIDMTGTGAMRCGG